MPMDIRPLRDLPMPITFATALILVGSWLVVNLYRHGPQQPQQKSQRERWNEENMKVKMK
jgi:hypothetical protein